MRNFLYFKEKNVLEYTVAAASDTVAILGAGIADGTIFDSGLDGADNAAKTTDAGKKLRITITSNAANTGNRGTDYNIVQTANGVTASNAADTVAGGVTVLKPEAAVIVGSNLDIPTTSDDAAHGYDLKVGDLIRIELTPLVDKGEACIAADRFIGANQASATSTVIRFMSQESDLDASVSADDAVTFTYASDTTGAKHKKICDFFADAATNYRANNDGFIEVDRNENFPKQLVDAGVTRMQVSLVS